MKYFVSLFLTMNLAISSLAYTLPPGRTAAPGQTAACAADSGLLTSAADSHLREADSGLLTSDGAGRLIRAEEDVPDAALSISAPSVLLMEASTGAIVYEKNSHEVLHPASITKIMTMILIFDALAAGQISPEDTVTVSEHAASMGGSQVFLEPGETQTVDTMLKCISIASANDACVAFIYSRHYSAYGF